MRIYLLASFPTLTFHQPAPFTFEALFSDCARHLSSNDLAELDAVCSTPPEGSSRFARDWAHAQREFHDLNTRERRSRLPAEQTASSSPKAVAPKHDALRADVRAAWSETDPLKRETRLLQAQWNWIEERRRAAPFTLVDLMGYALQLRLLERKDAWEEAAGETQFEEHIHSFLDPVIEEIRTQELSA